MKITYTEEIETRTAFSRKMYCGKCGSHGYCIHHQLEPKEIDCWWVECEDCGHMSPQSPDRDIAIARWKQG